MRSKSGGSERAEALPKAKGTVRDRFFLSFKRWEYLSRY
jgi:hypothetical protein